MIDKKAWNHLACGAGKGKDPCFSRYKSSLKRKKTLPRRREKLTLVYTLAKRGRMGKNKGAVVPETRRKDRVGAAGSSSGKKGGKSGRLLGERTLPVLTVMPLISSLKIRSTQYRREDAKGAASPSPSRNENCAGRSARRTSEQP